MSKSIKVKKDKKGNLYLDINDFADMLDISKVKKYTLEVTMDGETGKNSLLLIFYDGKNKIVEAK